MYLQDSLMISCWGSQKKEKKKKERNLIPSWAWGFKASDVIRK